MYFLLEYILKFELKKSLQISREAGLYLVFFSKISPLASLRDYPDNHNNDGNNNYKTAIHWF